MIKKTFFFLGLSALLTHYHPAHADDEVLGEVTPPAATPTPEVPPPPPPTVAQPSAYEEEEEDMMPLSLLWQPGFNFVWNKKGATELQKTFWGSWNVARFAALYDLRLHKKSRFFAAFGLGYTPQTYELSGKKYLGLVEGSRSRFELRDAKKFAHCPMCGKTGSDCKHRSKNWKVEQVQLVTHYFELMTEIKFRSNPHYKEGFICAIGAKVGFLWKPRCTITYPHDVSDDETKHITIQQKGLDFGLSSYRIGPYTRLNWGRVGLWGEWILSPLFNKKRVRGLNGKYTINAGLCFDLF